MQGGLFSDYFNIERRPMPEPIFVGVKRFPVDILYLDDLFKLKNKMSPEYTVSEMDVLRAKTQKTLSASGSEILTNAVDKYSKALDNAKKKGKFLRFVYYLFIFVVFVVIKNQFTFNLYLCHLYLNYLFNDEKRERAILTIVNAYVFTV